MLEVRTILGCEKSINQLYQKIGETYYSLHKTDPEKKLAKQVAEVTKLIEQLQELNDQQQALRGNVKCPHCQKYVPKNSIFCTECGARLLPETTVLCPRCHAVANQEMTYCPSCGCRLPKE